MSASDGAHALLDRMHPRGPRPVPPPQVPRPDAHPSRHERSVSGVVAAEVDARLVVVARVVVVVYHREILAYRSGPRLPLRSDPPAREEPHAARTDRCSRGVGAARTRRLRTVAGRVRPDRGGPHARGDRRDLRRDGARARTRRQGRVPLRDVQPRRRLPGRGDASRDPARRRAAARRGLPRHREHRVAQPARVSRRRLALRRGSARAPAGGRAVGRSHPVPGVRRGHARLSAGLHAPTARPRSCPAVIDRAGSRRSTR